MQLDVNDREQFLLMRQAQKMARSPHAFVRGNTAQHYAWLNELHSQLPEGPAVWICGDCHVGNLGPIADGQGNIDVQIRDLDQTVIGNPAHDLIRLALSLASAARGIEPARHGHGRDDRTHGRGLRSRPVGPRQRGTGHRAFACCNRASSGVGPEMAPSRERAHS